MNDTVVYTFGDVDVDCRVGDSCISITDSFLIYDDAIKLEVATRLLEAYPEFAKRRTAKNIVIEWKAHNILFQKGIQVERTGTTDIELRQDFIHRIGYALITLLFREKAV